MDNRYPKNLRLLTKEDFNNLRQGSQFQPQGVLLSYSKKNNLPHSRLGLAISKKVGNAVIRNKIKRKLKEYFRCSDLKNDSFDLLITLNFRYITKNSLTTDQVISELEKSFLKLTLR